MSPFYFKRTHIPTGKSEIRNFDASYSQFFDRKTGIVDYNQHKHECMCKIGTWNKMGIVDGKQMWYYEFIGTTLEVKND